jgi:hypothetical protein
MTYITVSKCCVNAAARVVTSYFIKELPLKTQSKTSEGTEAQYYKEIKKKEKTVYNFTNTSNTMTWIFE